MHSLSNLSVPTSWQTSIILLTSVFQRRKHALGLSCLYPVMVMCLQTKNCCPDIFVLTREELCAYTS